MKKLGLAFVWLLVVVGMFSAHMNRVDAQRGDLYGARAIQSLEQLLNADGVIGGFAVAGDLTIGDGFQILLPDGTVAAPSVAFTSCTGCGMFNPNPGAGGFLDFVVDGSMELRLVPAGLQSNTNGFAATPAYTWVSDADTGLYRIGANNLGITVGGGLIMDFEDTNAAAAGADLVTISSTLGIMDDGADVVRGLSVDLTNVNHTGGNVYGVNVAALGGVGADPNANEIAVNIANNWDYGLAIATQVTAELFFNVPGRDAHVRYRSHDLTFSDSGLGSTVVLTLSNFPDAVADFADLSMVAVGNGTDTIAAMDGTDTYAMLSVDFVNADHTGVTNFLYGFDIDAIVADPDATEAAVHLDASWDYALWVEGTTQDIDDGLTTTVMLSPTLAANDNANDQRNVLLIDVDIPNGSAGLVNGINIDGVTDDIQTLDSAIFVEGGWDSAITITEAGHAFTSNPLAGSVYITLDDSTDYSGGGGVDCWLVLRDAAGNNHEIVEVILNGACP